MEFGLSISQKIVKVNLSFNMNLLFLLKGSLSFLWRLAHELYEKIIELSIWEFQHDCLVS